MKLEKQQTALMPEYMKDFICDGAACEDNCCIGSWKIWLDQVRYKKLKKVRDKEFKNLIDKYIKRNHSNPTNWTYAILELDKDLRQCIFLSPERLCQMQLKLGVEYLGNVCLIYPRTINIIDGIVEKSATMSCPIAARLALLDSKPMTFEFVKEIKEMRPEHFNFKINQTEVNERHPIRYFWTLRNYTISILQDRNYSIAERLIILGMFYKKADEVIISGKVEKIPEIISSYEKIFANQAMKKELQTVPVNIDVQIKLIIELSHKDVEIAKQKSERYADCLREMQLGLGYVKENIDFEKMKENYNLAYQIYLSYIKNNEFLLENYLVNEVFRQVLPFGKHKTMQDSYITLVIIFSMVKLHLIGMAGYHKKLDHELVIKLIQSFSKVIIHNDTYLDSVKEVLEKNNLISLAYMSILIKN